jgi:hypothetical protein
LFPNLCTHRCHDAQRHTTVAMGGVDVESKPVTAIHRPEQIERPPPGTEPDHCRVFLRQQDMSDRLVAEKSVSQSNYGSHMVFCGVASRRFVDQRRQYGNVISCGAAHNEVVHCVHAIVESRGRDSRGRGVGKPWNWPERKVGSDLHGSMCHSIGSNLAVLWLSKVASELPTIQALSGQANASSLQRLARFPSLWPVFCCRPRGFRICAVNYLVLTAEVESQRIEVTLYLQYAAAGCFPGQCGYEPQSPSLQRPT